MTFQLLVNNLQSEKPRQALHMESLQIQLWDVCLCVEQPHSFQFSHNRPLVFKGMSALASRGKHNPVLTNVDSKLGKARLLTRDRQQVTHEFFWA